MGVQSSLANGLLFAAFPSSQLFFVGTSVRSITAVYVLGLNVFIVMQTTKFGKCEGYRSSGMAQSGCSFTMEVKAVKMK